MKPEEIEELKECFLDLLNQHCGEWRQEYNDPDDQFKSTGHKFIGYDSMCLSANEDALDLAVKLGWIKKKEVQR